MQTAKKIQKTLNVSDDLELTKISVPDIPKDIIFPDELNRYLRDQVQYLTHENGMLYKNLSDAELQVKDSATKINSLTSQLEEYQAACPKNSLSSTTANLASSKIVELSKKLRERNSEVQVYKTRCSKLEQHIFELDKNKREKSETVKNETEKPKNELEEQVKSLQEKLNSTNGKLCEARNSNIQLKNDLKVANKFLQQEVGESFETLSVLTNSNGNWRGRAQVICDLQQKNIELKEKLKGYQEKGSSSHVIPMHQIKQNKRIENLTKENEQSKNLIQDLNRKFDALKARNKVLESETLASRSKVSAVLEQSDRDHQLIATLTTRISHAQETQNDAVYQKQLLIEKAQQQNKDLQLEVAKQMCKLDNYQAQVDEQKREIESLKEKIKKHNPLNPSSVVTNEAHVDIKIYNQMQAERLRLLELTKLANERLESERAAHASTQTKFRAERQKAAKLEAKVARLELDQKTEQSSTYSVHTTKSKESDSGTEDRLELAEETIKALETRLQLERQEHNADIDEFSKILRNYEYIRNTDKNSS